MLFKAMQLYSKENYERIVRFSNLRVLVMEGIRTSITSLDLDNLLKIFDIQIALGVLIFFIIFRGIFARILIKIYYIFTRNKKNPKTSTMYKPLNVFFVLLGIYLMINILPTSKQVLYIMNKVFRIIVLFYIVRALNTLIYEDTKLMSRFFKNKNNTAVNKFICKAIRGFFWLVFIIAAFNEMGYDLSKFSGLAAGLGIGSAAIALAAQDLVKSILSGATILTDKPFVIGDWIEVGDYQGTVIDITFRSTRVKAYNNAVITIPNSTITSTYVINWNRLTSRRFDCVLNLSLETQSEKIKKVVTEIKLMLQNNPKIIKETVQVSLNEISPCSCDIKIFLFVKEAQYAGFLKAKQDILCDLLYLIEKENIDLAYPTQTLYVKRKEEAEV